MSKKVEWRPIAGYEEQYKISSEGEVRSIKRTYFNKGSGTYCTLSGMTLLSADVGKPAKNGTRYQVVNLCKPGAKQRRFYVHKLVAEAFLGPSNGLDVNHKDGCKDNNNLDNLEYVTRRENLKHAARNMLTSNQKPVLMIDDNNFVVGCFPSINKAADFAGTYVQNIIKVCQGKRKKSGGWRWMYGEDAVDRASELA